MSVYIEFCNFNIQKGLIVCQINLYSYQSINLTNQLIFLNLDITKNTESNEVTIDLTVIRPIN